MAHLGENTARVIEEESNSASDPSAAAIVPFADDALPPGVSQLDFDAVLAVGREKGELTQDELIDALHAVELTPEVLASLLARVNAEGVALVEDEEEELPPEPVPPARPGREPKARNGARRETNGKRSPSIASETSGSVEDPVHTYLKEIGRVPLLNAELEVEIAQTIEVGNEAALRLMAHELAESGDGPAADLLDAAGQTRNRRLVRKGQQAKDELIEANLRLVVSIAKRYRNRGLAFLDLIQEGNLGLMRAVDKFDHTKGFKFSTYATWWIRQALQRAVQQNGRTVRIPMEVAEQIQRVDASRWELANELLRPPADDEIADATGIPTSTVQSLGQVAHVVLEPLPLGGEQLAE